MNRHIAAASKLFERISAPWERLDQYYSVEIPIYELDLIYQFKIWRTESISMFILVKENSTLIPMMTVGDRLRMKYYSNDLACPHRRLDTEIQSITKQSLGRLRGHYLIGFGIIESINQAEAHWSYGLNMSRALPQNVSML